MGLTALNSLTFQLSKKYTRFANCFRVRFVLMKNQLNGLGQCLAQKVRSLQS